MGYSEEAYKKMIDLYNNHSHECGSQIISTCPGKTPTDCITYVINVLSYAFEKSGDKAASSRVKELGKYGTGLAAYLVSDRGWKAVYINPDVNHPRDKKYEHVKTYNEVKAKLPYYNIPIDHIVVNYTPTSKSDPNFVSFKGKGMSVDPTDEDDSQMNELERSNSAWGYREAEHILGSIPLAWYTKHIGIRWDPNFMERRTSKRSTGFRVRLLFLQMHIRALTSIS